MNNRVIVRGGGDIASGTIQKLHRAGFQVLVLEVEKPTTIRRTVSFSEAVYEGEVKIEGIKGVLTSSVEEIETAWMKGEVPISVDSKGELIKTIKPLVLVDGILGKKNLGTTMDMAPITIALGPGFEAGKDVNIVIETMRGHNLGRLVFQGKALDNTGIPGEIGGYTTERVIYSPYEGIIKNLYHIGDLVQVGETIALIDNYEIKASISGVLRGIIKNGFLVKRGLKIVDIDPRDDEVNNCVTISDKARAIGGGVLEGVMFLLKQSQEADLT